MSPRRPCLIVAASWSQWRSSAREGWMKSVKVEHGFPTALKGLIGRFLCPTFAWFFHQEAALGKASLGNTTSVPLQLVQEWRHVFHTKVNLGKTHLVDPSGKRVISVSLCLLIATYNLTSNLFFACKPQKDRAIFYWFLQVCTHWVPSKLHKPLIPLEPQKKWFELPLIFPSFASLRRALTRVGPWVGPRQLTLKWIGWIGMRIRSQNDGIFERQEEPQKTNFWNIPGDVAEWLEHPYPMTDPWDWYIYLQLAKTYGKCR